MHILLDCPDLQNIRQKYFTASYIFENVDNRNIIASKMLIFTIISSICYPLFILAFISYLSLVLIFFKPIFMLLFRILS